MLFRNDTFAIEYPCKLHVGHSVILCLIDIEHSYRLIQGENVVLILFWYRRIGITGVNFYAKVLLNPCDTTGILQTLETVLHWKRSYPVLLSGPWNSPWWNHQKTVFALWGEPSVTDEFPSQRASNAGLFFCISLDKRLDKRSDCQQFEKIGCSLWRYCNVLPNRRQRCNFLFKSYD